MGIKYENPSVEALKQMNPSHDSVCKILNVYVVYDLDAWPKILLAISNLRTVYLEQLV